MTAAAHSGVRSPRITPAPANVVSICRYRSGNPPSGSSSGCSACHCARACAVIVARSSSDAPARGGLGEDLLGAAAQLLGQLLQPGNDLPRPRLGDLPGGHAARQQRVPRR